MRRLSCLLLLFMATMGYSQTVSIIPKPASLRVNKGQFTINKSTVLVVADEGDRPAADFFNGYLKQFYGFELGIRHTAARNAITLVTRKFIAAPQKDAYRFSSGAAGVHIEGDTYAGTFHGIQTLIQLLPPQRSSSLKIAAVEVQDAPRFAYRGMHLDVARHYQPIDFIKKYIDYIALHKMNYFHWHLTDDQGWRIEIKKYPRLTSVGGWRNGTIIGRYPGTGNDGQRYGGYYTQDEAREIVAYAAKRHITVVPEIEMPGHASAAIAAYPELSCFPGEPTIKYYPKNCAWAGDSTGKQVIQTWGVFDDVFCAGKEHTFRFLEDVLEEILPIFPSTMIHVGGDECPKANWKRCANCQARMKEQGLKDEHELQSYFIQRMEKYLNGKGRKLIGWDEILEGGLAPNAAVMSWRGEEGGIAAAKQSHEVVMTPTSYVYFDYTQSRNEDSVTIGGFVDLERVYGYDPIPAALDADQAKYILGAQANLWTEYIKNPRKVEYMIFPRMTALSEVLWTEPKHKNWPDFEKRLKTQIKRYELWRSNYSRAYFDLSAATKPVSNGTGLAWTLSTRQSGTKVYYRSYPESYTGIVGKSGGKLYSKPVPVTTSSVLTGWTASGNIITQPFHVNKATGKKISLTHPPAAKYGADGAFTLVNGIQNEKGLARSNEFLGFEGGDCEATIDLGKETFITEVIAHVFEQKASWIYYPGSMEVSVSIDGTNYNAWAQVAETVTRRKTQELKSTAPVKARYVRVLLRNFGTIPAGMPGADHKAWLFIDEIEIN